jgi:glycosyltransferase involved in cell wall biosynthesis
MRVCLVYDHLFPHTVGGAERWMRDLALELAAAGHDVTYLTMRHWPPRSEPDLPGVRVLGLTDPGSVYADGRRTFGPPVRFGVAVGRHLLAHGTAYDVVHLAAFPYFPLLATGVLRRRSHYKVVVDWHEVWPREYWRRYAGAAGGTVGWLVQKGCLRVRQTAFCISTLQADRLVAEGYRGVPTLLPGLYAGSVEPTCASDVDPSLVVFAGRHVREKRVEALVAGFARARERRPELRLELFGEGPRLAFVRSLADDLGLASAVVLHGRRPEQEVADAMARAACLATASEREGYGLVVVEAAAHGTPSVIVAGPENAAAELVTEGINGAVAPSASAEDIADALGRVLEGGSELRDSTARWFAKNASELRIDRSVDLVLASYRTSGVD